MEPRIKPGRRGMIASGKKFFEKIEFQVLTIQEDSGILSKLSEERLGQQAEGREKRI